MKAGPLSPVFCYGALLRRVGDPTENVKKAMLKTFNIFRVNLSGILMEKC